MKTKCQEKKKRDKKRRNDKDPKNKKFTCGKCGEFSNKKARLCKPLSVNNEQLSVINHQ